MHDGDLTSCQCGRRDKIHHIMFRNQTHQIQCDFCGMNTGPQETKEDAITVWNHRHEEERLRKRIQELLQELETSKRAYSNLREEIRNFKQKIPDAIREILEF
jgi:molecular chaperone GrpE (heat shock protein)